MCGFKEDANKVFDGADIFSQDEENSLQRKCVEIGKTMKLDIIVVTTYSLGNMEDWEYAADVFQKHNCGYEEGFNDPSGLIFMISLDPHYRSVGLFSMGIGNVYYPDTESVDSVLDEGYPLCEIGSYYDAICEMMEQAKTELYAFEFADGTEDIVKDWYEGKYESDEEFLKDYNYYSNRLGKNIAAIAICVVGSLLIALIIVSILNRKYKNVMTVDGGTYFEKNSFKMHENSDNFIRTDVTRIRIESSSGGGGGGGRSHGGSRVGGGSRRF